MAIIGKIIITIIVYNYLNYNNYLIYMKEQ